MEIVFSSESTYLLPTTSLSLQNCIVLYILLYEAGEEEVCETCLLCQVGKCYDSLVFGPQHIRVMKNFESKARNESCAFY